MAHSNAPADDLPRLALGTFRAAGGSPFPGLLVDGVVLDVSALGATARDLLARWDDVRPRLDALAATAADDGSRRALDGLEVLAPVEPRQVVQAGANYRTHVIDLAVKHTEIRPGQTVEEVRAEVAAMMDRRATHGRPYIFTGLPSAVTGPYDDVVLPGYSDQHDWELELAAVIGSPAYRVSREEALAHVAAYTIVNDLTTRDRVFVPEMKEIGTDWFRAKNAPGFLPTGPFLVPADLVGDPQDLRIHLALNGEVMQDESTKDMLFGVAAVVSEASQTARLLPGDLVLTGSPAGNGLHHGRLLRDGDVMVGTVTGLGVQRTRTVAEVPA
ncbi:fumarylacetoacetate hydrolase family protein [Kineosporia sp. R_H_3]|uniref:fumarylacetoacetate hydrolase family protein n=1 Tax=Kineosporia sp. R_H_3 TaxID=1961848 RepID=UPI000B4B2929|nr:fumarylacetoacetate hydrolase family protein [Kineosporia sp. R_H_3]